MIDYNADAAQHTQITVTKPKKVLRMVQNERMGGSVPVWEEPESARQKTEEQLTAALTGGRSQTPDTALAYNNAHTNPEALEANEFGFADLVDMVNPLQHIPVVGGIYRDISGDDIKPIGKILGGAVFGGPLGAAGGLVNVVIEEETGKDFSGNAMAMMLDGTRPTFKSTEKALHQNPENRINRAIKDWDNGTLTDLPGSLLSFTDLSAGNDYRATKQIEPLNPRPAIETAYNTPRDEITTVSLSPLPPIY